VTRMERTAFLRLWLQRPREVGSVTPSSPQLSRALAQWVPWDRTRTLVELGAGTGPVTAELIRRLPPHARFLAFERQDEFRRMLAERYPGLELYREAMQLARVLRTTGEGRADTVVSGIPLALLSHDEREALLDEIEGALAPGGCFIAFQYTPFLVPTLRRRFGRVEIRVVMANLPPAIVVRCFKA
jgi:phospholipid N-methyltransferase